jgi:hypothetical protein
MVIIQKVGSLTWWCSYKSNQKMPVFYKMCVAWFEARHIVLGIVLIPLKYLLSIRSPKDPCTLVHWLGILSSYLECCQFKRLVILPTSYRSFQSLFLFSALISLFSVPVIYERHQVISSLLIQNTELTLTMYLQM